MLNIFIDGAFFIQKERFSSCLDPDANDNFLVIRAAKPNNNSHII
jgi:hypothetical protein